MQPDLLSRFNACRTKNEAIAFAMAQTPEERANLHVATLPFLQGEYSGITGENTITIPLMEIPEGASYEDIINSKASPQDAETVYEALFNHIAKALIEAQSAGKPLSVHVGEIHADRGCQMINLMVLDIARRLDIQHIGFELSEEEQTFTTHDKRHVTFPAFDNWEEYHRQHATPEGFMPETDEATGPQPDKTLVNMQELVPLAKRMGYQTFAIDTAGTDTNTSDGMYLERERYMMERTTQMAPQQNAVIFGGNAHLYGLSKLAETCDRATCFINGAQTILITPPAPHDKKDEHAIERGTFPAFQPLLKTGRVHNYPDAQQLAKAASRAIGNKLEQKFKPLLAKAAAGELSGIDLGGRIRTEPERLRA